MQLPSHLKKEVKLTKLAHMFFCNVNRLARAVTDGPGPVAGRGTTLNLLRTAERFTVSRWRFEVWGSSDRSENQKGPEQGRDKYNSLNKQKN